MINATPTLDEALALACETFTFVTRPIDATCRYCGDPIPLFVDSKFYCSRDCRDCAWAEMEVANS